MRPYIHLLLVIGLLLPYATSGQKKDPQLDSLNKVVEATQGRFKIEAMVSIIRRHLNDDLPKAYDAARKAQNYAYQIADSLMMVKICHAWGIIYRKMDSLDRAETELKKGIAIAKRNNMQEYQAKLLNSLALIYYSKPDKAIECQQEAIRIHKEMDNKAELSICYNNVGLLFFKLNNFAEAISYYQKSKSLKLDLKDFYDLDIVYVNMALCFNQLKQYDSAELYIQRALATCSNPCNPIVTFNAELCRGVASASLNKNDLALEHYYRALTISKSINETRPKIDILTSIGSIYVDQKKYLLAIEKFKQAEKIAIEAELRLSLIEIYKNLSTCYFRMNDPTNQSKYQLLFMQLKDSIYTEGLVNSLQSVADSVNRGDIVHHSAQSKSVQVEHQNYFFNIILFIALLLTVLSAYFLRKAYNHKKVELDMAKTGEGETTRSPSTDH